MPNSNRLMFLDNIRYFIIFFVMLQHVALIYIGQAGNVFLQRLFQLIVSITDVFMMPPLFFFAGYFALNSITRHGTANFISGKFKRIWLPWLAGVILLIPISIYLLRIAELEASPLRYGLFFLAFMKSAVTFHTGYYISGEFGPRHLWFLSNLFVLFLCFAGYRELKRQVSGNLFPLLDDSSQKSAPPLAVLFIAAVLSGLAFFAASMIFTWGYRTITILNLVYFEPSRITFYIIYFITGVYAASRGWFSGETKLGNPVCWAVSGIVILVLFSYVILFMSSNLTVTGKFLASLLRAALCISMFGAMLTYSRAYWNRPNPIDTFFSRNSYTVYIIHYPINAAFAVLLMTLSVPVIVKAAILFLATATLSYLASEFAVRRHVGYAVAAVVVMNAALMGMM